MFNICLQPGVTFAPRHARTLRDALMFEKTTSIDLPAKNAGVRLLNKAPAGAGSSLSPAWTRPHAA
jgi:hypothetical protein